MRELGTSVASIAAALGVYCAVVAVALPIVVRACERWGSRRIGVGGQLLFAAPSLGSPTAHPLPVLLSTRALQGLGAASLLLLSMCSPSSALAPLAVDRDGCVGDGRLHWRVARADVRLARDLHRAGSDRAGRLAGRARGA
ncbi:MAG: MFS transporter [Solirubrobacterales bacterium]|nr:MFS transporter [Solirubrobacterales bacterium]